MHYKKTTSKNEIRICCPYCDDTKYHLYINTEKGVFQCFKCGYKGKDYKFVTRTPRKNRGSFFPEKKIDVPQFIPLTIYAPPHLWRYAKTRLSEPLIHKHQLAYSSLFKYRNRILIPITQQFQMVYWQARTTDPLSKIKYINPNKKETNFSKSKVIFNLDYIEKTCIVCEGIFSAIAVDGVAILGKTLSFAQIQLLVQKNCPEHIVMLDPDASSQESWQIAETLVRYGCNNVKVASLQEGDPAEVSQNHVKKILKEAKKITTNTLFFDQVKRKMETFRL